MYCPRRYHFISGSHLCSLFQGLHERRRNREQEDWLHCQPNGERTQVLPPSLLMTKPGFLLADWSLEMTFKGDRLLHLKYISFSYRTFTNLRLTKRKCISDTSISFVTCTYRLKTTQVSQRKERTVSSH